MFPSFALALPARRFVGEDRPAQKAVQDKFAALDQKPINSAADATNFVTLLIGKPTHAFDADRLAGGKIIVRMAKPGETLKTLDGLSASCIRKMSLLLTRRSPLPWLV